MKLLLLRFYLIVLGVCTTVYSYATHVRAGEITARRISTTALTYEITLTTYHDEIGGRTASEGQNDVTFCIRPFGGGSGTLLKSDRLNPRRFIGNATTINIFKQNFTFSSPGVYTVSVGIENRNEGVRNMTNSRDTPFYVETTLVINASLGLNRTPVMLNPPLDSARVGQKFCHNPAAFDADGDSLAYRLSIPKQGTPETCINRLVNGYLDPALGVDPTAKNELQSAPATFTINPRTGDLCWDAPSQPGMYNVAFIVEEWRDGVKIGEIVRDMQIIVADGINRRPLLDPISDLCVEAGQTARQTVKSSDPDNNRLLLTAYGGVFNKDPEGRPISPPLIEPTIATFTPSTSQVSPAVGTFSWLTNCTHIREAPYDIVVKVEDLPTIGRQQLASFQTFTVKVVAPKPRGLTIATNNSAIPGFTLKWSAYGCPRDGAQMIIYRKEGCSGSTFTACTNPGDPLSLGYKEVGRVPITTTTFTDDDQGKGLRRGVQYSYRIKVIYALPQGGGSALSDEACLDLPAQAPIITHVTIDTTNTTKGVITVRWTRPPISPNDFAGPYQYRISRAIGLNGTDYVQIATIPTTLGIQPDTVYKDRNLNTVTNAYRYKVEFFYTLNNTLVSVGSTEPASSVRLDVVPVAQGLRLFWRTNVPWRNENRVHRVYREVKGQLGVFNRIADVPVQGANTFTYVDDGTDRYLADGDATLKLNVDLSYCYRVETIGGYDSQRIQVGQLLNLSQIVCATPVDSTSPCPPVLSIEALNCDNPAAINCTTSATNTLNWTLPSTNTNNKECAVPASFNIYYARYQDDTFKKIGTIEAPTSSFKHTGLDSYAGCYYITAITRLGLESAKSNIVCNDNCANYVIPNVFTPNNDGKNDFLKPITCSLFVESVKFVVYNRWGKVIYETTDKNINWDGTTTDGQPAPAGTYYYQAIVMFKSLQREPKTANFKGWIQLIR